MYIEIVRIKENKDGSATLELAMDSKSQQLLMQVGFNTVVSEALDKQLNEEKGKKKKVKK